MLSDMIGRIRGRGNDLNGPIQISGLPMGLLAVLQGGLGLETRQE